MPAEINIHASCVQLADAAARFGAPPDAGVLLLGPSGSGKSDLALRLIGEGAVLIADDRVILRLAGGSLTASAPAALAGLLEVRGLGIVKMPHAPHATLAIAVQLGEEPARLPQPEFYAPPPEVTPAQPIPLFRLNAQSPSAASKILLAAAAFAAGRMHAP